MVGGVFDRQTHRTHHTEHRLVAAILDSFDRMDVRSPSASPPAATQHCDRRIAQARDLRMLVKIVPADEDALLRGGSSAASTRIL